MGEIYDMFKAIKFSGSGSAAGDVYTKAQTDALLAEKADARDMQSVQASVSALQTSQTVQDDILAGIVDKGAKNRIIIGFRETTKSGITITPEPDGTLTLNGTNNTSSSTILVFDLYANASASTENKQDPFLRNGRYVLRGTGSSSVRIQLYGYNDDLALEVLANSSADTEFTVDGSYKYYVFRIWVAASASFDNTKLYPMCCSAEDFAASEDFCPYVPSNAELYAMLRSLSL